MGFLSKTDNSQERLPVTSLLIRCNIKRFGRTKDLRKIGCSCTRVKVRIFNDSIQCLMSARYSGDLVSVHTNRRRKTALEVGERLILWQGNYLTTRATSTTSGGRTKD